jgi:hypothetical protein
MVHDPSVWAHFHLWPVLKEAAYTEALCHLQAAGEVVEERPAEEGAESSGAGHVCLETAQRIERKPDRVALGLSAKDYGARLSSLWTVLAV